jgi:FAD/FMN-containing dehydrogenase
VLTNVESRTAEALRRLFSHCGAHVVGEPVTDFSRLHRSASPFCAVAPCSPVEAEEIARVAARERISIRVRGAGHALNGSSLPRAGELVFDTRNLTSLRYEQPATVTAGAGLPVWVVRALVNRDGWTLPVVNDGYSGPSVGGYVAAGGFGPGSADYGGFWENVLQVRLLTPNGVESVRRHDALFPWLFGAMGQLGIVLEATLDLVPLVPAAAANFNSYSISELEVRHALMSPQGPPTSEGDRRLYWFTLFVSDRDRRAASEELAALQLHHAGTFEYLERYCYFIRHCGKVAVPLVYPHAEDFYALGIWGFHDDASPKGIRQLHAFESDFMRLALDRSYRRYVQSELPSGPDTYARYFTPDILASLRVIKRQLDPRGIFNAGWLFLE